MADPIVLTNATIWHGGYDLSGASNEVTFTSSREEKPHNNFGDTVDAVYPGVIQSGCEVGGFFDSDLDGPEFAQAKSQSQSWPLTVCPAGTSVGDLAYTMKGYTFNYSTLEASWGQSLPYRLSTQPSTTAGLGRGMVVYPKTTYTANYGGGYIQLGALSATQKLIATLHVFSIDGGSWGVWLLSDADGAAAGETQRATQTITTAPQATTVEVFGPVTDTYWRGTVTKTGGTSITIAYTYAIVNV